MSDKRKGTEHRGYQPMSTPVRNPSDGNGTTYQGGYQPKSPQSGKLPTPPTGSNSQDA